MQIDWRPTLCVYEWKINFENEFVVLTVARNNAHTVNHNHIQLTYLDKFFFGLLILITAKLPSTATPLINLIAICGKAAGDVSRCSNIRTLFETIWETAIEIRE